MDKILELEKKLKDMELKYDNLFEIVEELSYYFMKEISDPYYDGDYYYPTSIPRDNSGLRYHNEYGIHITSRLNEVNIKEDLYDSSPSDLIKKIKKEGISRVAPKHLWSIYDKVEKLKKREKKELVEKRIKKCIEIIKKVQSEKEDKEKRKKELREKIRKMESEAEVRLLQKELDKYEEED